MSVDWTAFAQWVLIQMEWSILVYFLVVNGFYGAFPFGAALEMKRHLLKIGESRWRILGSNVAPRISILAPAYNEAATVRESLRALLSLYHPSLEVIVINDGSRDSTLDVLQEHFDLVLLHPIHRRQVETKPVKRVFRSRCGPHLASSTRRTGEKRMRSTSALTFASGELVCAVDSDALIELDVMQPAALLFQKERRPWRLAGRYASSTTLLSNQGGWRGPFRPAGLSRVSKR